MLLLSITLLLWGVQILAGSQAPTVAPTPLAVLDFDNNSGNTRYDELGRGLAAMMVTDLTAVPAIRVVERSRLQDLITEMNLQQTAAFDSTTAQELGRLVGAEYVVFGSIATSDPQIRLDTRIVQVTSGEVVKTAQVTGRENKLFDLQEKLANELIDGIEVTLSPEDRERLRQQQESNRIDDWDTMVAFSNGIARMDARDFAGGVEELAKVATRAPRSAVVKLFYDEAVRRAAANARDSVRDAGNRLLRGVFPG